MSTTCFNNPRGFLSVRRLSCPLQQCNVIPHMLCLGQRECFENIINIMGIKKASYYHRCTHVQNVQLEKLSPGCLLMIC
ncbi:hypothetical protein XENTR_v10006499 [Xenopus tropicalis]|nr:hypothetical protein XENTR_v10006499 [Xenopus tropicalis]